VTYRQLIEALIDAVLQQRANILAHAAAQGESLDDHLVLRNRIRWALHRYGAQVAAGEGRGYFVDSDEEIGEIDEEIPNMKTREQETWGRHGIIYDRGGWYCVCGADGYRTDMSKDEAKRALEAHDRATHPGEDP
jgi:hypothetical protein